RLLALAASALVAFVTPALAREPLPIGTMTADGITNGTPLLTYATSLVGPPAPGGRPVFQGIRVSRTVDSATAEFFIDIARGVHIPSVQISLPATHGGTPISYLFNDVTFTGQTVHQSDSGLVMIEDLTFDFGQMRVSVTGPSGTVVTCFDKATGNPC